ncbi:MAG: FmdE family protein [Desulfohalobiaceae bacterium]
MLDRIHYFAGVLIWVFIFLAAPGLAGAEDYEQALQLGRHAACQAAEMLDVSWSEQEAIVLTNAGYARAGGSSTQGCLDGLSKETGASLGKSSMIKLQARFDQPLWFAFYVPESGQAVYLQLNNKAELKESSQKGDQELFEVRDKARIDSDYLFEHPEKFEEYSAENLFGTNLFRVIAAANLVAQDVPQDMLQCIQPHDHYCPGVTSGVLLARFIEKNILADAPDAECFVLSLQPWCKEDALQAVLNVTPGKRSYGTYYPEQDEVKAWPSPLDRTSSIVFVRKEDGPWQGWMLEFDFDQVRKEFPGPKPGSGALDKLALGLWMTETLDDSGRFVSVLKKFELEKGQNPRDFLRPEQSLLQELAAK